MTSDSDSRTADQPADPPTSSALTRQAKSLELPGELAMLADTVAEATARRDAIVDANPEPLAHAMAENAQLRHDIDALHEQLRVLTERLAQAEAAQTASTERLDLAAEAGATRARAGFLSMMSHELRTPLNAIGGYAELLETAVRGPVNEAQREDLRRIRRAQRHLVAVISDILNLGRLEHESVQYDISDVSVDSTLDALRGVMEPQLHAGGVALRVYAAAPNLYLRADVERVNQILLNLAQNAIRFTPAGRITVFAEPRDTAIAFDVTDTGHGIAASHLATIWEPFVQVGRHLSDTSLQGVGLGLPTSRAMAQAMGGALAVTSALGVGSTFTLTLPRVTAPFSAPRAGG